MVEQLFVKWELEETPHNQGRRVHHLGGTKKRGCHSEAEKCPAVSLSTNEDAVMKSQGRPRIKGPRRAYCGHWAGHIHSL